MPSLVFFAPCAQAKKVYAKAQDKAPKNRIRLEVRVICCRVLLCGAVPYLVPPRPLPYRRQDTDD